MSRFEKLSHVVWHCEYPIIWVPKYRYRILTGAVRQEVHDCIQVYSRRPKSEVTEIKVQSDHVHLLIKIPPKQSISSLIGALKDRTEIRVFK